MRYSQGFKHCLRTWGAALLLAGASAPANALVQTINAEFKPDPTAPHLNKFENKTPQTGVCPGHMPSTCKQLGIFSIRTNDFQAYSTGPIQANHADPRQGAMWQVPSSWRDLTVTHQGTGRTETVQFRIAGIGHRWDVRPGVNVWARPGEYLWGSAWRNAPSPCTGTNFLAAGVNFALFFWLVPEGAGVCNRVPGSTMTQLWYSNLEYAYEIRTPNPLEMASGQYTGSTTYTMGPGADFDFGDVVLPRDNLFTFNFILDVRHELKVEVPPGGNRVELVPEGGWQAWLNRGRKPSRLFRDQTVNIWSSSQFKMTLACSLPMGNTCGISDSNGNEVPVEVAVTLPSGLTDAVGRPVNRLPLRLDGIGTELFQPIRYVDRKPSTLHFEITRDHVEQMLGAAESRTYSGSITVIWDSEV